MAQIQLIAFNLTDYCILVVILISTLISLLRGFMREAISLVTWIVAFWCAFHFSNQLDSVLSPYISNATFRIISSCSIIFIIILIFGTMFNFLISLLVTKTGLSGTDRLLGMMFGLMRGVLLVAVILLFIATTAFSQETWFKNSQLIPQFKFIIVWLKSFLPDKLTLISDTFINNQ
jgi:membrane protein required for colicin V production